VLSINRILVPTDFSKHAEPALTYAAEMAEKFGAELILLHVVQDLTMTLPDAVMPAPPPVPPIDELTAQARTNLEHLVRDRKLEGFTPRLAVTVGDPADAIVHTAEQEKADLLVITTHGRTGLAHLLLGSVAEHIIRRAKCPVLTVRSQVKK
jgi:nucleotide-binding universal stress UspA family protein